MQKTSLSYQKFASLLERHKYVLVRAYCEGDDVRFFELKSPHHYKTFFVYVPERYSIFSENIEKVDISQGPEKKSQVSYLDLFPEMTDVLVYSSDCLCYRRKDSNFFFQFEKRVEVVENDPQETFISELESKFKNMKDNLSHANDYVFVQNIINKNCEIIFEDGEGNVIEKGSNIFKMIISAEKPKKVYVDKATTISFDASKFFKGEGTSPIASPADSDIDEEAYYSNEKPLKLEKLNVGILYVCSAVNEFTKVVNDFEQTLVDSYSLINIKEQEMHQEKMREIHDKVEKMKIKAFEELKNIEKEDSLLNEQINRVSAVMIQCEKLKTLGKDVEDISKIMNDTRETLDELHLKKLKSRDTSFEILQKYLRISESL